MTEPRSAIPSDTASCNEKAATGTRSAAKTGESRRRTQVKPAPVLSPEHRTAAEQLMQEGLTIRWAGLQRKFALQGPLDFSRPHKEVPVPGSEKDLCPKYLKRWPAMWAVTPRGYEKNLAAVCTEPAQQALMARYINDKHDELGVFLCEKTADGWLMVVEF